MPTVRKTSQCSDTSHEKIGYTDKISVTFNLVETIARLNQRLNDPFVTVNTAIGDLGIKQAKDDCQQLMNNKSLKNKRK